MQRQYTISQLAKTVGAPITTLRYYERVGLLEPEERSESNYRLYTEESGRRLKFIRAAQAIGFTLDDVRALLGNHEGTPPSCFEVQGLIEDRLAHVDSHLKHVRHVQRVLKTALQRCQETGQFGSCTVIDSLQG